MDTKITTAQLNIASLTPIMEHFLDDFHKLITYLTHVKLRKPRKKIRPNSKPYDDAIILGLPSQWIAQHYGSTFKNIEKRKSELKKQGIVLLDARSRTSRLVKFITKNKLEHDEIFVELIRKMIEKSAEEDIVNRDICWYLTPSRKFYRNRRNS